MEVVKPRPPGSRMNRIRILVADDHRIFLEGVVRLLKDRPDLEVVGTAGDGRSAVSMVKQLTPDVVLTDISMPNLNGMESARLIKKVSPRTKVLVLSMHESEEFLKRVLEAGGSGYLLKETSADELYAAIKEAHRGNIYLSPSLSRRVIRDYVKNPRGEDFKTLKSFLTDREREVVQLLAEGHSSKAAAKLLNVSVKTVETHRKHIMKKLNLHSISELIRYAIQQGIIES